MSGLDEEVEAAEEDDREELQAREECAFGTAAEESRERPRDDEAERPAPGHAAHVLPPRPVRLDVSRTQPPHLVHYDLCREPCHESQFANCDFEASGTSRNNREGAKKQ